MEDFSRYSELTGFGNWLQEGKEREWKSFCMCMCVQIFITSSFPHSSFFLFPGCSPVSKELTVQLRGVREVYVRYVKK